MIFHIFHMNICVRLIIKFSRDKFRCQNIGLISERECNALNSARGQKRANENHYRDWESGLISFRLSFLYGLKWGFL